MSSLELAISASVEAGIGTIIVNRPKHRNAISNAAAELFAEALAKLSDDAHCRVIVIRGAGGHFCAGWDVSEFRDLDGLDDDEMAETFAESLRLLDRLENAPKPVIAAVEGAAMGFGFSLVARADVAIAAESASFAIPELKLGLVPGVVLGDAIRILGLRATLDWMLTATARSAEEGLRLGLVSRVVPVARFEDAISDLIENLLQFTPSVVAEAKRLARRLALGEAGEKDAIASAVKSLRAMTGVRSLEASSRNPQN